MRLYRKRTPDGRLEIKDIKRTMFTDDDAFRAAVDHAHMDGFVDTSEEACGLITPVVDLAAFKPKRTTFSVKHCPFEDGTELWEVVTTQGGERIATSSVEYHCVELATKLNACVDSCVTFFGLPFVPAVL